MSLYELYNVGQDMHDPGFIYAWHYLENTGQIHQVPHIAKVMFRMPISPAELHETRSYVAEIYRRWQAMKEELKAKIGLYLQVLDETKKKMKPFVPVRSGRLLDELLTSFRQTPTSWNGNIAHTTLSTRWSTLRPYPITGNPAHSGREALGEVYTPKNVIPNRNVAGPNTYILNDPQALNDPLPKIGQIIGEEVKKNLINFVGSEVKILRIRV